MVIEFLCIETFQNAFIFPPACNLGVQLSPTGGWVASYRFFRKASTSEVRRGGSAEIFVILNTKTRLLHYIPKYMIVNMQLPESVASAFDNRPFQHIVLSLVNARDFKNSTREQIRNGPPQISDQLRRN